MSDHELRRILQDVIRDIDEGRLRAPVQGLAQRLARLGRKMAPPLVAAAIGLGTLACEDRALGYDPDASAGPTADASVQMDVETIAPDAQPRLDAGSVLMYGEPWLDAGAVDDYGVPPVEPDAGDIDLYGVPPQPAPDAGNAGLYGVPEVEPPEQDPDGDR